MPTIGVTVNHVTRYLLSGAFFIALTRLMGFRVEERLGAVSPATNVELFVLAALIGSLTYWLHRVLLNPIFHRLAYLIVEHEKWFDLSGLWVLAFWWPRRAEINASAGRHGNADPLDYFLGWSAEIHFVYQVAEIALFCVFIWPGWGKQTQWWWWATPLILVAFNFFWDVTALRVELTSQKQRGDGGE